MRRGYPDANNGDRLADDPIQKRLLGILCTGTRWRTPCRSLT